MTKETPIRRSTRLASKSIQKTPPSIALPKSKRKTTKKEAPLTQVRPCRIELWKSSAEEDDLFTVRRKLNAYFVPSELPCREKEFEKVYDLVSSSLQSGNSRVLYISGVPGTGKTSTVLQVFWSCHFFVIFSKVPFRIRFLQTASKAILPCSFHRCFLTLLIRLHS